MLYFTQIIFIHPEKEAVFHEFENLALPILAKYNGRIIYRIRPNNETFIDYNSPEEKPYEIHFLSFDSEQDFQNFAQDNTRKDFLHLKEESISATLLVKGERL